MPDSLAYTDLERLSDTELIQHARAHIADGGIGSLMAKEAVALVYLRHRDMIRTRIAMKVPRAAVDDCASAVYERFVRLCYRRTELVENFAGLLVRMAQFEIATHHGRTTAEMTGLDQIADLGIDDPDLDGYATAQSFEQLMGGLSDRQRRVVGMRISDELTSAEIAAALGMTVTNVDVTFHRATHKLRETYEP